ncbi:hypothetical protein BJ170DRAFT_696080 [Xylariales sp. AK1849]|nr:hypothetical protein BJ170DRAFT_696080 [Xylariales sp. AK1849]
MQQVVFVAQHRDPSPPLSKKYLQSRDQRLYPSILSADLQPSRSFKMMRVDAVFSLGLMSLANTSLATKYAPLNITALTSRDGYSTIECWQLSSVPVDAMSALNYGIGNISKATWSTIQPRTVVGEAWAPAVQLTVVLNGLIHVSAPAALESGSLSTETKGYQGASIPSCSEAYFQPGTLSASLLLAADLKSTSYVSGHWTEFPGNGPTILIQTPFVDNQVPNHTVLHDGPCA